MSSSDQQAASSSVDKYHELTREQLVDWLDSIVASSIARGEALERAQQEIAELRAENERLRVVYDAAKVWGDAPSDDPIAILAGEFGMSQALTDFEEHQAQRGQGQ